jgi:glycosyltransferase involved in cell wall biosynthesis
MSRIIVAIPVCNEVERIKSCLLALARQNGATPDRIVLLLNNCIDGTAATVLDLMPTLKIPCNIIECELRGVDATAGFARRLVMQHASVGLSDTDILVTTDADGQAAPDWILENVKALQQGADAVCGRAEMDSMEELHIPRNLREDDFLECKLSSMLDEISARLDIEKHDPLPRHTEHSGASIAVTVAAWRRAGGVPAVSLGEDRAFIQNLKRIDARIRHAPSVRVTVSARTQGRAAGGMADTIRRRIVQQDEFVDDAIEPTHDRYRRIGLRVQTRSIWSGAMDGSQKLACSLGISDRTLQEALSSPFFGTAWSELERCAPVLRRRRVRFLDLPQEIEEATALCCRYTVSA